MAGATLATVSLILAAAGLSGIAHGDRLSGHGDFAAKQAVWVMLAIPVAWCVSRIDYRKLKGWSSPAYGVSLLLLVAVYFFPSRFGAHRWIPLGVLDVQPSELAKLAYILALGHYLMYRRNYRRLLGLLPPFTLTVVPVLLILREPDLGTSLLFFPVLYAMLFAAGARWKHLLLVALMGAAVLPPLWAVMSAEQKSRVTALFSQTGPGPAPRGDGYHLHQSKQVLALGGPLGSEVTEPAVEYTAAYHLPASRTDFVFCLIGERWGFAGTAAVLALYVMWIAAGLHIAAATQEPFGRLVAVGIVSLCATQVIINTGMTVGLMPITGLTLPLLSYGGSSLLTAAAAVGLMLSVHRHASFELLGEPFRF